VSSRAATKAEVGGGRRNLNDSKAFEYLKKFRISLGVSCIWDWCYYSYSPCFMRYLGDSVSLDQTICAMTGKHTRYEVDDEQ
jgi:hypothetical protein